MNHALLSLKKLSGFAALAGLFLMPIEAAPPSPDYKLFWADAFDGPSLDTNVWTYRLGERLGSIQLPGNVAVKEGRLEISFRQETIDGKQTYTSGGIITRLPLGYGYYEIKSRLWGGGSGLHSSFWHMGTGGDGLTTPKNNQVIEIDGYEVDSHEPKNIEPNIHYYVGSHTSTGNRADRVAPTELDSSAEDFILGYEWLPNAIRWYINGKLFRETRDPKFYASQQLWITALGTDAFGKIDPARLPGVSRFDDVRYYVRDLPGAQWLGNGGFEFNQAEGFEKNYIRSPQFPVAWCEEGQAEASLVVVDASAFQGGAFLRHGAPGDFQVSTVQRLPFLPASRYRASVRCRGTGEVKSELVLRTAGREARRIPLKIDAAWNESSLEFDTDRFGLDLAIESRGRGGAQADFDEVSLVQISGNGRAADFARKSVTELAAVPGAIVLPEGSTGYSENGEWLKSSLSGWDGKSTRYLKQGRGEVCWKTSIPVAGSWKVEAFIPSAPSSHTRVSVSIDNDGEPSFQTMDQTAVKDWVTLGTWAFRKGGALQVRFSPDAEGKGYLRASALRLTPSWSENAARLTLARVGQANGLFYGQKRKVDPDLGDLAMKVDQGTLFASAGALRQLLGADGNANLTNARFMAGGTFLEAALGKDQAILGGNKAVNLGKPVHTHLGRLFIPVEPVLKALGFSCARKGDLLVVGREAAALLDEELLQALPAVLDSLR